MISKFWIKIFVFVSITMQTINSWSQINIVQQNYFNMSGQYGFTISSVQKDKYFIQSRLSGFNIFLGKTNSDSLNWSKAFRNPLYGFGMQYHKFNETKILGNAYTLYYKINIPFFLDRKFGIYYSTAIGTTIIPKSFQPQVHYLNHANGSKFNFYAHFGVNTRFTLLKNYLLLFGLNYYHVSNGNIKLPNNGLNLLAIETGIDYKFNTIKKTKKFNKPVRFNENKYLIAFSTGSKQIKILGNQYFVSVIEANYYPFSTEKRSIGAGTDLVIDKTLKHKIQTDSSTVNTGNQYLYNEIYFSHSLNLNRIQIVTNIGAYIDYHKIINENVFYYLGIRYFMVKNIVGIFGLKANLNGGDYVTFGLGYSL